MTRSLEDQLQGELNIARLTGTDAAPPTVNAESGGDLAKVAA